MSGEELDRIASEVQRRISVSDQLLVVGPAREPQRSQAKEFGNKLGQDVLMNGSIADQGDVLEGLVETVVKNWSQTTADSREEIDFHNRRIEQTAKLINRFSSCLNTNNQP